MSRLYWLFNLMIAGLVTGLITHQTVTSSIAGGSGSAPASDQASSSTLQTASPSSPGLPVVITPSARPDREAAIAWRGRNGHFMFDTAVNGIRLPMMFDTGASFISLRAEDAARVGIDVNQLVYSRAVSTPNGITRMAPITIDTLTIGTITRRNVPAFVGQPGKMGVNLLGQSFMERIAGFNVEGNQLILKGGG